MLEVTGHANVIQHMRTVTFDWQQQHHQRDIFHARPLLSSAAVMSGGGAILAVLSPGLSGLCLAIFSVLWGFTILYGSYSRHSQRVVQVGTGTGCGVW